MYFQVNRRHKHRCCMYYQQLGLCCNSVIGVNRIMKLMVQSWIRDVTTYQNVFADQQIMHFYRSEELLLHAGGYTSR